MDEAHREAALIGRRLWVALPILLALASPLTAHAGDTADPVVRVLTEPRQAPNFRLRTLGGMTLDLASLTARGPLVLDFWATWCKPCVTSLPELESLWGRYAGRGVTVLGVSIDGPRNVSRVRPFLNKLGLTFPVAIDDDGAMQERFQVVAVPTTIVIGADRRIRFVRAGYGGGGLGEVEDALRALLPADSSAAPADSGTAR
jgi:peroxiredoxin